MRNPDRAIGSGLETEFLQKVRQKGTPCRFYVTCAWRLVRVAVAVVGRGFFFRLLDDEDLGREHKSRDRRRVLDR